MIVQATIAAALLALAIAVAWWLNHRQQQQPTPVRTNAPIPAQLVRTDFPRSDAPWLVALFSSATCDSCGPMAEKVQALESDEVAVVNVDFATRRDLHERYGIEAVPIVVVVDSEGVTRASFAGNASATDLWAAVAQLRT
jgi:Thioredoxin